MKAVSTHPPDKSLAVERLPAWQWALRLIWIAIQIILVCWFAQKGLMFVYQGF
jgi:hypothetical protein